MLVALSTDTLLGTAAVLATLSGLSMTFFSYISGRKDAARKAARECHEALIAEQRVSEDLSRQLYEIRMKETES